MAIKLIKKSKLAFSSAENFLSIFCIDCINNGTPIIYDKNIQILLKHKNKNYIAINFNNIKIASHAILKLLPLIKEKKDIKWWNSIFIEKRRIRNYLLSYLPR
jgi:3-isopropylmalate dehydratase small subunit